MKKRRIEAEHTTQIRVRYADTDKMGFVYHGEYLPYFETGRTELMRNYGLPYIEFENAGYFLPLVKSHIEYKTPGRYDDLLDVSAKLVYEYGATVRFEYNISRGNTTICKGFTEHAFFRQDTGAPVKPPVIFVKKIENFAI